MKLNNLQLQDLYKALSTGIFSLEEIQFVEKIYGQFEQKVIDFEAFTGKINEDVAEEQQKIHDDTEIKDEDKGDKYIEIRNKFQKKWDKEANKEIETGFDKQNLQYVLALGQYNIQGRRSIKLLSEILEKVGM